MTTANVAMPAVTRAGVAAHLSSSTPVAESGKRKRSDDDPSDLATLTDEATVSAPIGMRKKKRRKGNKPESEVSSLRQQVVVTAGGASCSNQVPDSSTNESSGTSAAVASAVASAKPGPPSDPLLSAGGNHAGAAASGMMAEICGDGHIQLSQKQLDFVDSQVWEAIGKSKDVLRFERMRVEQGIFKVQCSNTQSLEWLTKTVAAMPAFEGCKFVIRQTNKIQKLVRVSMLIPGPPREPHAIISRLHALNEGLDTKHWRSYHYTKAG